MTNDVHSLIARLCDEIVSLAKDTEVQNHKSICLERKQGYVSCPACQASDKIADGARLIKDDAEKMLGLLLEAREALKVTVWKGTQSGRPGYSAYEGKEDGPLGKKIAEFLEGK